MADKYAEYRDNKDALSRLSELAYNQMKAQEEVARMETALKTAKASLATIAEEEIPALMEEVGMQTFTTTNGLKITLKDDIKAKIPAKNTEAACAWVEGRGDGEIIKRLFNIQFGRDEEAWANKFERDLRRRKKPLRVERTKGINAMTLKAYLKRLRREGVDVPMDLFGAYEYRVAKVDNAR